MVAATASLREATAEVGACIAGSEAIGADEAACGSFLRGSVTVTELCRNGLLLKRDFTVTDDGRPLRSESYAVRDGRSYLRVVKAYEGHGNDDVLVRRERHSPDSAAGCSRLKRVRWVEPDSSEENVFDSDGQLVKRRVFDEDGLPVWVVEFRAGTRQLESVRQYSGRSYRALLFDSEGNVHFTTDRRGYDSGLHATFAMRRSEHADSFYPPILEELQAHAGTLKVLFLGDSLTAGWRGAGAAGDEIWQQYYAERNAVPAGIGLEQTQHLLWRLNNAQLDGIAPELVVLNIGTNNVTAGDPVPRIVEGIIANVAKIRASLPMATIVLTGLFPRNEVDSFADRSRVQINAMLASWSYGADVVFRDLADRLTDETGARIAACYADEVHLSKEGYARWAEAIEDLIP